LLAAFFAGKRALWRPEIPQHSIANQTIETCPAGQLAGFSHAFTNGNELMLRMFA
jgi:hypothetical protein